MLPDLRIWLNHFEYHAAHRRTMPAALPDRLTPLEQGLIARSLACCARTERSAARHLLSAAYRFSERHAIVHVARIAELLLREQRQHARLLEQFQRSHALPLAPTIRPGRTSRRMRRWLGPTLELELCTLLRAELTGIVLYRVLEQATGSQRLRLLTRMLVADQLAHVGFASDLLMAIRTRRGLLARAAVELLQWSMFMGAAVLLAMKHRALLRHKGARIAFLAACRSQYRFYLRPPQIAVARMAGSGDVRERF